MFWGLGRFISNGCRFWFKGVVEGFELFFAFLGDAV